MTEQQAIQFLSEVRRPLLALHKAILDHERASYEKEFGPATPAAFLQVLINGSGFRWLSPLSTVIADVDETLDDKKATELYDELARIAEDFRKKADILVLSDRRRWLVRRHLADFDRMPCASAHAAPSPARGVF